MQKLRQKLIIYSNRLPRQRRCIMELHCAEEKKVHLKCCHAKSWIDCLGEKIKKEEEKAQK